MEEVTLTQEVIDKMKEKFGEIYKVNLGGKEFVYRPMKRIEYKQIMSNPESPRSYIEEQVVQRCLIHPVLDPTALGAAKAGTVSTITELIMQASNFGITEEPIKL